jgi:hypothetical protein
VTYQSIQLGMNNEPVDDNLESHIRPVTSAHDSRAAGRTIQTRTGVLDTYQQHTGAQSAPLVTSVQLKASTGLVQVPGTNHMVTPEVLETMRETSPELFEETATPTAPTATKPADNAKDEEAAREAANRHPDEIEGYHQHILGEVATQDLIGLMVYGQKGETIPAALVNRIASQMGETVDTAVQKLNLVKRSVDMQFTLMAQGMGLDANRAALWIAEHRKDTAMAATQAHYLSRDKAAWTPLLTDYAQATGDGRKR